MLKLLAFTECFGRSFEGRSEPIDFYWEREWRSLCDVDLNFDSNLEEVNVFVGLCNHEAIQEMESEFDIPFIDPMKNLYIYFAKLKKRSKDLKLENTIL